MRDAVRNKEKGGKGAVRLPEILVLKAPGSSQAGSTGAGLGVR